MSGDDEAAIGGKTVKGAYLDGRTHVVLPELQSNRCRSKEKHEMASAGMKNELCHCFCL